MINGGGDGRRYLPKPNAAAPTNATTISGRYTAQPPSRRAQCSHTERRSNPRQPLKVSRSPHSAQKLARCIARVVLPSARIILRSAIDCKNFQKPPSACTKRCIEADFIERRFKLLKITSIIKNA